MTIIMVIMVKKRRFSLMYAPDVKQHLSTVESKYHSEIKAGIEDQSRSNQMSKRETESRCSGQLLSPRNGNFAWDRTIAIGFSTR